MMDTHPGSVACAQCGSRQGVPLSDGQWFCLDCRHEGVPTTVRPVPVASSPPSPAPGPAVTPGHLLDDPEHWRDARDDVEGVFGPPDDVVAAEAAQAALDALVGTWVILDGGQRAKIVEFPDDDNAIVDLVGNGDDDDMSWVDLNDVVRSVDTPAPVVEVANDPASILERVNAIVGGMLVDAGTATMTGDYADLEVDGITEADLLDGDDTLSDPDRVATFAVAVLKNALAVVYDLLRGLRDGLEYEAETTEPTKGGNDDEANPE